jgi:ribosome-associated protein
MTLPGDTSAAEQLAVDAARCAAERNCEDVVVLDLRELSPLTDFFVICTGTSDRQMRAVADDVDELAEGLGHKKFGQSGRDIGQWILLDYVDVVVHFFDAERRNYYDLEMLWGDAQRIDWALADPTPSEPDTP